MSNEPSFLLPTAEGLTDINESIQAASQAGKWTMIAPDGRTWFTENPMILMMVLSLILSGGNDLLQFEPPGPRH